MPPFSGRDPRTTPAGTTLAKHDAALAEVVGGHLHANPVAHHRADAKLAHLARGVGDDPVFVFQHDAEAPVREDLVDLAIEGQ